MPIKVGQKRNHTQLRPLADRLWAKVQKSEGCWLWRGATVPKGYGKIGRGRRENGYAYTHRVAWELANGPIPDGMAVMHVCDNPPCCNPAHLMPGTIAANNRDMAAKGRQYTRLTPGQVLEVRTSVAAGESMRAAGRRLGVYPQVIRHALGWSYDRDKPAKDAL